MALNSPHLDEHLKRSMGATGYSISGANATITGSLTESQLHNLVETSFVSGYKVTVVSGVLTLSPR